MSSGFCFVPAQSVQAKRGAVGMRWSLGLIVLLFLAVNSASAATCSPLASGNWSNAGIWNCGAVPGASDTVEINGGYLVTLDVNAAVAAFTLNNGTLRHDSATNFGLTVNGLLTVNGNGTVVNIGAGTFALAADGVNNYGILAADRLALTGNLSHGSGAQLSVGHLIFQKSGTQSAEFYGSNATVTDLTVNPGTTLNSSSYSNLRVQGNLNNLGTFSLPNASLIANGTVAQTFGGAAPLTLGDLQINNAAGLTLGVDVTINDELSLTAGVISAPSATLVVGKLCAQGPIIAASAASYVDGNLRLNFPAYGTSCLFPLGSGGRYAPLTVTYPWQANLSGGAITARTISGDHPDTTAGISPIGANVSVNRYWSLSAASGVSIGAYSATFQFCNAAGCGGTDVDSAATPANFIVARKLAGIWSSLTPSSSTATTRTVSGVTGFGEFAIGEPGVPVPLADYHFDECSYNGTTGEVIDSQGGYHGTSSGATKPSTQTDAVVGRSLNLAALNQYVTTGSAVPLPGNYTVAFWTKFPLGPLSGQRYYVAASLGATSSLCRGDFLFFDSNNAYRWGVYSRSGGTFNGTTSISGLTAGWHHLAVVASGGSTTLFIDGVQKDSVANTANAGGSGYGLRTLGSSCDDLNNQAYRTPIDEFMVFGQALNPSQINQIYANQRAGNNYNGTSRPAVCNPGPHHFQIEHASGSGLTCAMSTLKISACANAACTSLYTGGVSGSLTASGAPAVVWDGSSGGATGSGFVLPVGVGFVTKSVQVSTPGSVVFGVSGAIPTSCTFGAPQCTFTASDAGFVVAGTPTGGTYIVPSQVAGTSSGTLYLRALQASTTTPAVCTPAIVGQTVPVNLGYACNDPTTCATGNLLAVNSTTPVAGSPNSSPTQNSTAVNLTFDANGSAPITLNYADVGRITLYASKTVTPPNGTPVTLSGNSNAFVVKPFSFVLSVPLCQGSGANPGAADAQGGKFCPAGEDFSLTVTAVANGGAATPNYGKELAPEGVRLVPALVGGLGLAANPAVSGSFGSFSNGAASGTAFSWGEVGIITLQAGVGDSDYLGAGDVLGTASGNIGRFYPYAYTLDASAVSNRPTACAPGTGSFTYIGEPDLRLDLTLSARNKQNGVTANYRSSATAANNFAKLNTGAQFSLAAVSGATKFSEGGRYAGFVGGAAADVAPNWANGTSALRIFSRLTRAASFEEFLPGFTPGIRPVDSDGVGLRAYSSGWGAAWDLDTDATVGNDHKLVGLSELRSGRIRLQNANGSELLPLPVPLQLQFWNGAAGWQANAADTCTKIEAANFAFTFGGSLAVGGGCKTGMAIGGTAPNYTATLSAPVPATSGWADLTLNLAAPTPTGNQCTAVGAAGGTAAPVGASWLQFPWSSATAGNPTARATFGVYRSGPVIHRREAYR